MDKESLNMTSDKSGTKTRKLEKLVEYNRITIALVFPVVGVALLYLPNSLDSELLREISRFPPGLVIANIVMALPLIAALLPLISRSRKVMVGLTFLALFSYSIEIMGVKTGYPYGEFSYRAVLEPTLFGVPLALPLFWLPVLINAFFLSLVFVYPIHESKPQTFLSSVVFVVLLDLILDPGAVALGFWSWEDPGVFYGVPVVNFLGWGFSGTVGAATLVYVFDLGLLRDRVLSFEPSFDTLIAFLTFWGLVNILYLQIIPLLIGVILLLLVRKRFRSV